MTNKRNPKYQELVAKLREIFQIDRPELDFGIYRILNARAGEINDYLENRLADKVQAAFSAGSAASAQQLQTDLDEAIKQAQALGANPDDLPKVKDLRARLKDATAGRSEHENAVFSHLLTFFSRYYQDGDFISQRRYKGGTYAIPYAGEEVMLHWANKDQYYTKSGENFSNYSFKLPEEHGKPGRNVHFRLMAADTAKDNRKDNDKERRFALVEKKTVTRIDDQGDEYEEENLPVEEADGADATELIIRFEYAVQPKGTKQEALVTKAVETVLADAAVKARWLALGNRAPTEKNPQRTLLEKHLTTYTTKNTADYFIHKDLGGFMRRELDFYIKNEVMHLDDVQNAGAFADIEKSLRMIQCLRIISLELITFLAQLEDFQKKLWLKKKFVVSSHYCITLDRVPEALWPEVVANAQQWARWKQLGVWDGDAPGTVEGLKAGLYRMVDTSLFTSIFQEKLLKSVSDLDADTDGLLVHGDNFQALNLLRETYRGQIGCIYLDPPYNTGSDGFAYKDGYAHSSWLALASDRLACIQPIMASDSVFFSSIDDNEAHRYKTLLNAQFGEPQHLADIIWQKRYAPDIRKTISDAHEYIFAYATDPVSFKLRRKKLPLQDAQTKQFRNPDGDPRGPWKADNFTAQGFRPNQMYPITVPSGRTVTPPTSRCWGYTEEIYKKFLADGRMYFGRDGDGSPALKRFLNDMDGMVPWTWWNQEDVGHSQDGLKDLMRLFGKDAEALTHFTAKPVSLIARMVFLATDTTSRVADFFAGSGTTAQAVITENRKDNGTRKYLLCDKNEFFDTILAPRIQKVVFSSEWGNGKPLPTTENRKLNTENPYNGISHCFKIIKLESYEDALNNLQLRRTDAQGDLLNSLPQQAKDDYLLRYMLDVESRGSLLSVDDFKKPFDYTLNIAVDSAGAFEPRKIDLVETFNYLVGLRVKHIDAQPQRGFATVTGTLPSGESCLVLWRDCDALDYEGVNKLCNTLAINPADNEFDVVYINGDHNIPTVLTQTAEEGGATRVLKLRQIEPEFLSRMFSVEDV